MLNHLHGCQGIFNSAGIFHLSLKMFHNLFDHGLLDVFRENKIFLDCVAAITAGILVYETPSEGEVYVALDEGVLVKTGADVSISVRRAMSGANLSQLRQAVEQEFNQLNTQEKDVRSVMAKLETGFLRQFASFQHD